jgi:hypothetical protein
VGTCTGGTCACPALGLTTDTVTLTGTCAIGGDDACTKTGSKCTDPANVTCLLEACQLSVTKTPCVQTTTQAQACTGGAVAITIKYTGPDINVPVSVVVTGSTTSITRTYNLSSLHNGDVLTSASENGFTLDATAHANSKLGSKVTATITAGGSAFTEIFHTSCSCTANPSVNLVPGAPMCLDSGSPDNSPDLLCESPGNPKSCCADFDSGTCTGAVCTAAKSPLFCCSGAGSYSACKGAESPAWTLVNEVDPKNGLVGSSTGTCSGNTLPAGQCADVTYTYTITNSGAATATNIVCTDDKLGALTLTSTTLAPGASETVTTTAKNVCSTTQNTVTCTVNGVGPTGPSDPFCQATASVLAPCTIAYPFTSSTARTSQPFNESTALTNFEPKGVAVAGVGQTIQAFYTDEHALTLGVSSVTIKSSGGTSTATSTVTSSPASPACMSVAVGFQGSVVTPIGTDEPKGVDTVDRPLWPALFITNITSNTAACSPADYASPVGPCCDWQALQNPALSSSCVTSGPLNQVALKPTEVCGVWKSAARSVNETVVPITSTVIPGSDPAKNGFNMGAGADKPGNCSSTASTVCLVNGDCPAGQTCKLPKNLGYTAEARWSVDDLVAAGVLNKGNTYRFQFMVHDGDQNKTGGDVGEACVDIFIPK